MVIDSGNKVPFVNNYIKKCKIKSQVHLLKEPHVAPEPRVTDRRPNTYALLWSGIVPYCSDGSFTNNHIFLNRFFLVSRSEWHVVFSIRTTKYTV